MELTQETQDKLKVMEANILREFVGVCNKLNLHYFLLAGTLLGAVRHQGFIPWDDDMDVGMPREDYEVFLREGQTLLPDHLFIQTIYTDPGYMQCFAKIRNSNSTFVETSVGRMDINHGVFIDVFPLDYYPVEKWMRVKFNFLKKWYDRRIGVELILPQNGALKGQIKKIVMAVLMPSLSRTLKKRDQLFCSVEKSGWIANYGSAWGEKEIVPADWYGDGVPVLFEGMQLMAPEKYGKWLTQVYGDYMQLPPIEKRVGHHYVDVVDLNRPYTEYVRQK